MDGSTTSKGTWSSKAYRRSVRSIQNDRDHQSYVLDAGKLRVQVRGEGSVRVEANVDEAIVVIILGDHNPLDSGELLFQLISDGPLLLQSEGGGTLACTGLVQGIACGSYSGDESLLLAAR
jgi:hypothetical protein